MRIGLFGGSFNPPHEGHLLVARTALKRLKLDRVWWLVTPGNPLKEIAGLPSQAERMAQCRALIGPDPRIIVTGIEAEIGTRYTEETIRFLKSRCPGVNFVWLMGADNLASFHRWRNWRAIAGAVPMAVIDRPGSTLRAASSRAAQTFSAARRNEREAAHLATMPAPAWVFLHGRRSEASSTALRARLAGA
ncbi:MAG: nicotinic acid mononucleotide adenylyltransferase [Rhizobiales bacterium PAR1]|nr:MAG: nicotinic acid mononucleotide adenylyltransferase [Rhizobiales bacterium PAR1]